MRAGFAILLGGFTGFLLGYAFGWWGVPIGIAYGFFVGVALATEPKP